VPLSFSWLRRQRVLIIAIACALVGFGAYAFFNLGIFMAHEDPLQPADAIFVFAGTVAERPLEAAELYRSGLAPRIVITRATIEQATFEVQQRGVRIPTEHEINREVLSQLGIPESALVTPTFIHDNTGEEARTLRELALAHHWRRVIVVSSKYHLRRVAFATRRQLRGTEVEILARGSRYDRADPARWWTRRSDIRSLMSEVPKVIAYALGIGL
jgi:uncharacterized SAM-binding protein YcdF (DUF218 family)